MFLVKTLNEVLIHPVLVKVNGFRFTVVTQFSCKGDRKKPTAVDAFLLLNRHYFYAYRGLGLLWTADFCQLKFNLRGYCIGDNSSAIK